MRINIKAKNIELDEALKIWVNRKIGELEKLLSGIKKSEDFVGGREEILAEVEIGKTTRGQLKGDIFRAEAQLYFPQGSLRAESTQQDLRTAINEVKDELQREIRKYKERKIVRVRKGARMAKKRAHSSPAILKKQEKLKKLLEFSRLRKRK